MGGTAETDIKYTIPASDVCAVYALELLTIMCVQSEYVYKPSEAWLCERENKASGLENGGKHDDKI